MAETDLWFGTLSTTVRVEDLPASRRVVAIELPADGRWRVCGAGTSNSSGVATLPITGLPTSRIYAVAIDDWGRPFVPGMTVAFGDVIRPTQFLGWMYQVTAPGVLPTTEPDWWNSMAGIPQPVGTAMMQAIRHYQPIAHGPVSDIEWEEKEFDPFWDNVVALLRFDGNLNNEKGAAWSIYGPGTIDTANPIFGIGSLSNTGRGGAVSPTIERIDTNDSWTIEGFVYCTDRTPLNFIYTSRQTGAGQDASTLLFGEGLPLSFQIFSPTGVLQQFTSSAPLMPLNVVTHVAVSFDKPTNTLRIFQAGQKVLEEPVTVSWTKSRLSYLACYPNTDQPTRYLRGRLDEWRETVGVARYTETFDPPVGPFPNVGPPL